MGYEKQIRRKKKQIARRQIVSELYLKCFTINQIRQICFEKLGERPAVNTIWNDIKFLKNQWQEENKKNIDNAITAEVARIDDIISKLWKQWEKSCEDYEQILQNIIETPKKGVVRIEKKIQKIKSIGAVNIIAEMRAQMIEKRKLLGMYKDVENSEKSERLEQLLKEIAETIK